MRRMLGVVLLVMGSWAWGCGEDEGGGPVGPGPGGDVSLQATIDGQAWASDANFTTISGNAGAPRQGTFVINGFEVSSGTGLSLILSFVTGPGTYPLGVNVVSTAGGTATVSKSPSSWLTPLTGAAGTVTITTRTSQRIAGTFSFTADRAGGTGPLTTVVTNGSFDITVAGQLPALPTGTGSVLSAVMGGASWNAATVVATRGGPGSLLMSASNTVYTVTFSPKVAVAAGNTYGIPSQVSMTIIRAGTPDSWTATSGPDVGSLTLTGYTSTRAAGTFSGTIPGLGATSALEVAEGTFDVHLEGSSSSMMQGDAPAGSL